MKRMRDAVDEPETVVDRLRGTYPTATPPYATSPLQQEAAREIERLREKIACFEVAGYRWFETKWGEYSYDEHAPFAGRTNETVYICKENIKHE